MTQGIFIEGRRPRSKKQIKEAVEAGLPVRIEATSWHGDEYDGDVSHMPLNQTIYFVGPDPFIARNFYGQIKRTASGVKVT